MQTNALKAGCEIIFTEIASGAKTDRIELDKLLTQIRKDDTLVVNKLDRLGRSLKHLLELVTQFNERQIRLQSIIDAIDTTRAVIFNISACFTEFERDLIRERTNAGLAAARARGRKGGRRQGMTKEAEKRLFWQNTITNKEIWQSIKLPQRLAFQK